MFHVVLRILLLVIIFICKLLRLGKRELMFLQSFTCNYVFSVKKGFFFPLVVGIGCVILLLYSLGFPYNYLVSYYMLMSKCYASCTLRERERERERGREREREREREETETERERERERERETEREREFRS